jgi:hypothetical protein
MSKHLARKPLPETPEPQRSREPAPVRGDGATLAPLQRLARTGGSPAPGDLRALQRLIGNRAVVQLLRRDGRGEDAEASRAAAAAGVSGSAAPLPHLDRLQAAFGHHDLSGVQSYTGPTASAAAQAIGAEAYATGERVAFAEASPSLRTVAHEAAHIVQQRAGVDLPGGVGSAGDRYERDADAIADRVVSGEPVAHLLPAASGAPAAPASAPVQRLQPEHLAALFAMADAERSTFEILVRSLADATNGKAVLRPSPGMKKMGRSIDKTREKEQELGGKEQEAVQLQTDILAGTIAYKTLPDMAEAVPQIEGLLALEGCIVARAKNRIADENLRDFLINIRMPSGLVVEIQLHFEAMLDVKQGKSRRSAKDPGHGPLTKYTSHDLYDVLRIMREYMDELAAYRPPHIADEEERRKLRNEYAELNPRTDHNARPELVRRRTQIDERISAGRSQAEFWRQQDEVYKLFESIQKELMTRAWEPLRQGQKQAYDKLRKFKFKGETEYKGTQLMPLWRNVEEEDIGLDQDLDDVEPMTRKYGPRLQEAERLLTNLGAPPTIPKQKLALYRYKLNEVLEHLQERPGYRSYNALVNFIRAMDRYLGVL